MTTRAALVVRIALLYLAVIELATGVWALVDPSGWFRNFPGLGRHWTAVDGPFNHHLAVDAGAGFAAVGVLLVIAAVRMDRRAVQLALVALLVHEVPHLVYHLAHGTLSGSDLVISDGGLALGVALAAAVLAYTSRLRTRTT